MIERAVPVLPGDDLSVAKDFYVGMSGHGRKACVSLRVASADAYFEEWRHKIAIERPPRDEYWGARTFGVTDPAGNTIFVIGPLQESSRQA